MAIYKDGSILKQSNEATFDQAHNPGNAAPHAGIYRCIKCGHEIGIAAGHVLPAQSHSQHPSSLGSIQWRLAVFAEHNR